MNDSKQVELGLIKKSTISSQSSEGGMSVTSELNSSERFNKLSNLFQLPLFEIHNTMQMLLHKTEKEGTPALLPFSTYNKKLQKEQPISSFRPHKSHSVLESFRNSDLAPDLSPEQAEFYSKMAEFKSNFLVHTLNFKDVYFQYVTISKSNLSVKNSADFAVQQSALLAQAPFYAQNKSRHGGKKTLILDLDETLVHAAQKAVKNPNVIFLYRAGTGMEERVQVKLRPYLFEFLDDVSEEFELILYTSAEKDYADTVLDFIERRKKYFAHRLYKKQCLIYQKSFSFKILDIFLHNREIKNVVIVDNSVRNFSLSVRNGIPIKDFLGSEEDRELIYLSKYLKKIVVKEDVRNCIKEDFAGFLLNHYQVTQSIHGLNFAVSSLLFVC